MFTNEQISDEMKVVLRPDEKVIAVAQPNIIRMAIGSFIAIILVFLFKIFFTDNMGPPTKCTINGVEKFGADCDIGLMKWILIALVVFTIFSILSAHVKRYILTDRRLLVKSGLIGTDYSSIFFNKVEDTQVLVGLVDKFFDTGILIVKTDSSMSIKNMLVGVDKPYAFYQALQEAIDISRKNSSN